VNDDRGQDIEREARERRKFSPQEALARLAGPGAMKGVSPVSPLQQAEIELGSWLGDNLEDDAGALRQVVLRELKGGEVLLNNLDQPLVAFEDYCRRVLATDGLLADLVRQADVEWGRMMDERPHFERAGCPPHAEDPYTVHNVHRSLSAALRQLARS
jgi:hypothetical protein